MSARSALMRSPGRRMTRSPRTSWLASITLSWSSRRTRGAHREQRTQSLAPPNGQRGTPERRRRRLLRTITTTIATASGGRPARSARPLATHSRIASKWVNCLPRCRSADGRRGSGSLFGPSAARRRAASTELSAAMTGVIADSHVEAAASSSSPDHCGTSNSRQSLPPATTPPRVSQPFGLVISTLETAAGAAVVAETVAARRSAAGACGRRSARQFVRPAHEVRRSSVAANWPGSIGPQGWD